MTNSFYHLQADAFEQDYISVSTEQVHGSWLKAHLPLQGNVLDVGAGVGRDALYFAEQGLDVIAIEPAENMLKKGQTRTEHLGVMWLNDQLPELKQTLALQMKFDLIVLSAVWMHVAPQQRERAFRKLSDLLKPSGTLVITLRHGPSPDERIMHPVSADELAQYCKKYGLVFQLVDDEQADQLQRSEVSWQTVVAKLPDDGTGYFPIIRNIVINDAKSSTYKLALLRTVLRIADGHPGAVLAETNDEVVVPLGLVALYWIRQYKPLLQAAIRQGSSSGLGFVKEDGWHRLEAIPTQSFGVGEVFSGEEAQAVHNTLKHVAETIERMPANYITYPNSDEQVFGVKRFRTATKKEQLVLDLDTLSEYGEFVVPRNLWQSMAFYSCWIEPVVLNEWAAIMQRYNPERSTYVLLSHLGWLNAERSTIATRQKIDFLLQENQPINCVWSGSKINTKYAVDHCLPFARWPNNDLWNLLPTLERVNAQKSDKLPSNKQLQIARKRIINWWQTAWETPVEQSQFFTQAQLSLPKITSDSQDYEAIFKALEVQSRRLFDQQQIGRWELAR